jgi:hypothetical protein
VLRAERAKVNRFNGFRAAVSAALDKAGMRPAWTTHPVPSLLKPENISD